MAINPSIAKVGVAIISDPDNPPAAPTYTHGLLGGTPFQVDASTEVVDVSCGVRASIDAITNTIAVGADIDTEAYADVLGVYCYGALGDKAVAAGSDPGTYDHTFTMGDSIPELDFWGQVGNQSVTLIENAKIDQLDFEYGESQRLLRVGVTLAGMEGSYGSTTWPGGSVSCFDGAFTCTGGTLVLSLGGANVGSFYIKSGQLTLSNNLNVDYSATETDPAAINEGKLTCSGQMVAVFDSDAFWRLVHTGAVAGTDVISGHYVGGFQWDFVHTKEATFALQIAAGNVPMTVSNIEADPSGTQVEATISWDDCLITSPTDTPVTIVLTNDVASY